MCGRFTLAVPPDEIAELLGLPEVPKVTPRYNIAPSQDILTGRLDDNGQRAAVIMKWGLSPAWAGKLLINARGETLTEKPTFRKAFRERRCVIPADGFFEWLAEGKKKRPHRFRRPDRRGFLFAGLWDPTSTCTIVTTAANAVVRPFHDRMPVILPPEARDLWLAPRPLEPDEIAALLTSAPDDFLMAEEVSPVVNNARYDDPECIEPVAADGLFGAV